MTYRVLLTRRAKTQLEQAYGWFAERSPQNAARWYEGFLDALESLRDNPYRCAQARENPDFPIELRQLLYDRHRNHRAVFTIRHDTVVVLAIRQAAQQELTTDDLV